MPASSSRVNPPKAPRRPPSTFSQRDRRSVRGRGVGLRQRTLLHLSSPKPRASARTHSTLIGSQTRRCSEERSSRTRGACAGTRTGQRLPERLGAAPVRFGLPPEWGQLRVVGVQGRVIEAGDRDHVGRADGDDSDLRRPIFRRRGYVVREGASERRGQVLPQAAGSGLRGAPLLPVAHEVPSRAYLDRGRSTLTPPAACRADVSSRIPRLGDSAETRVDRWRRTGATPADHFLRCERSADVVVGAALERRDRIGGGVSSRSPPPAAPPSRGTRAPLGRSRPSSRFSSTRL